MKNKVMKLILVAGVVACISSMQAMDKPFRELSDQEYALSAKLYAFKKRFAMYHTEDFCAALQLMLAGSDEELLNFAIAQVLAKNPDNQEVKTLLLSAIKNNRPRQLAFMIQQVGLENALIPNERNETLSLLAVQYERHDILHSLLAHEPDISLESTRGMTALVEAAKNGDATAVALLMEAGADADQRMTVMGTDYLGKSARDVARAKGIELFAKKKLV